MLSIRKALKEAAEKHSVLKLLDSNLAGFEEARSHKVVHVSDLSKPQGFCPREFALLDVIGKKAKGQYVSAAMRVAFDNGHALHDLCRNKWLRDEVIGDWICSFCGEAILFSKIPKVECKTCHKKKWFYREPNFIDLETKVSGSIDFFIDLGLGLPLMVEVKSISVEEFEDLKAPLAEHRIRTQLYLYHLSRFNLDNVDLSRGIVLYISKGFGKKIEGIGKVLPFREFTVERNDVAILPLYEKAIELAAFRAKKGPMPQGICPNSMVKRVKSCGAVEACWSGKYPGGV